MNKSEEYKVLEKPGLSVLDARENDCHLKYTRNTIVIDKDDPSLDISQPFLLTKLPRDAKLFLDHSLVINHTLPDKAKLSIVTVSPDEDVANTTDPIMEFTVSGTGRTRIYPVVNGIKDYKNSTVKDGAIVYAEYGDPDDTETELVRTWELGVLITGVTPSSLSTPVSAEILVALAVE